MAFEGVKWMENNLDASIKDNVYDYLVREASGVSSELDLNSINSSLSDYDDIEESWSDSNKVHFALRITGVKKAELGSRDLFMTTDLPSSYLLQVPDGAKNDDYYMIRTDKTAEGSSMGLPGASLVGSVNCQELLEEK